MTNTKTLIAASLLVAGLASTASASESFLAPNSLFNQNQYTAQQTQRYVPATQAYAYAPATAEQNHNYGVNAAETREFNRVDIDSVSSR